MKKVLVISEVPTHPVSAGNAQYTLMYIDLIKEMGYEVYYCLGYEHYLTKEQFEETKNFWGDYFFYYKQNVFISFCQRTIRKTHKIFKNITRQYAYNIDVVYMKGMNSFLRKIQRKHKFDIVIVNYITYSKAFLAFSRTKKILVTHDVFTNRYERTGENFFFTTSAKQEKKALDRSDCILSIQENESIFFRYLTNKNVITGFCPMEYRNTRFCGNQNILYVGSDNPFNVKGLIDFIENALPKIIEQNNKIKLIVAGSVCEKLGNNLLSDNLILLGRVDDVDEFYSKGDIIINPTESGSGLKIKNIEALAYNKVLISHPHTVEGLYSSHDIPIMFASTPDEYAKMILKLFENPSKIQKIKEDVVLYMDKYNKFVKSQIRIALDG